ncbi:DNA cytosine methyltransferase [Chromobacterium alkanivorans]|nr:DNA cytosine methyltransferase [Chromobacterium alkanivorans]
MANSQITTLGLCAGVGMLDLGVQLALEHLGRPARALGYVERDAFAASSLLARMEDAALEPAPVWAGNLQDVRWERWAGCVDGILAGFPCQPHSMAGNRAGTEDDRWTWPHIVDCLRLVRPGFAFLENVSGLRSSGGLDAVLSDLAALGFTVEWDSIRAADVDAGHQRERVFILAYRPIERSKGLGVHETGEWLDRADTHWGSSIMADASHSQGGLEVARGWAQERAAIGWTGGSHDDYVANTNGDGRPQGRPEQPSQRRYSETIGTGGPILGNPECARWPTPRGGYALNPKRQPEPGCSAVANPDQPRLSHAEQRGEPSAPEPQRRREAAKLHRSQLADADSHGLGTIRQRQCQPQDFASGDLHLADAGSFRLHQGGATNLSHDRPDAGANSELPLFAPGPVDPRWGGIVADHPHLAPAIEPGVRVLADGLAYLVDESRSDQLRCVGNGVVALQAAVGFITLARRAGIA